MSSRSPAALCLALLILLCSCAAAPAEPETRDFFAMDTLMSIQLYGPDQKQAADAAVAEVNRLDKLLSRTVEGSDIVHINKGGESSVTVSPETASLLVDAQKAWVSTDGSFDVTIAPVMDAWGFGTSGSTFRVPTQPELDALLPLVDSGALQVDLSENTVSLNCPGMAVDLGGIAKGYAADRLFALLKDYEISSALLNLGTSTISALGNRPDGTPWRIALRDPQKADQALLILALSDQALSTSGGYERFFEEDGVTYHHILDPNTGYPAETGLLSVTVVSASGAMADAWSTALYVLGADKALELWRESDDFECILCCADGTVLVTEGLEDTITFEGEENGYTYELIRR